MKPIPFNRISVVESQFSYIQEAFQKGHISGDGPFTKRCSELIQNVLGVHRVLLTSSGTHALELSALLLDIEEGDEVIVPSFTFPSTVNAFVLRGANPVFCDIRPDTLNIDEALIESLVTSRTKAIIPVHYAGVGCEMRKIMAIARRHDLHVVEDNAHGLFGSYRGAPLGTFGSLAAQSFHETKNFSCGEGGALLINDPSFAERAEIIREKGTDRSRFHRGQVDKYTWVDTGSSYLPSDILAAILWSQLEVREEIQGNRRRIWESYANSLIPWAAEQGVQLPTIPPDCQQPYHMFYLLMPDLESRQELIAHLAERGVSAVFHYLPLHLSRMGRLLGGMPGDCPVTENISDRLLRLPLYSGLAEGDQERVIRAVQQFHRTTNLVANAIR